MYLRLVSFERVAGDFAFQLRLPAYTKHSNFETMRAAGGVTAQVCRADHMSNTSTRLLGELGRSRRKYRQTQSLLNGRSQLASVSIYRENLAFGLASTPRLSLATTTYIKLRNS